MRENFRTNRERFLTILEPMKKILVCLLLFASFHASSQSVFGYWYGYANVKTSSSANNYLVELILQPEKGYVKGILNYYFRNTYRSLQVKGNYNTDSRQLSLYNIPVTYHGSASNLEVDCIMNMQATLRVAKAGSSLLGNFISLPDYKYLCPDISFMLNMNADISKKDSVLKALREYKENYQVWKPSAFDTLPPVNIIQRKVINYVIEDEFRQRENTVVEEIEVESDSLQVDFYDNAEVDGDSISIFYHHQGCIRRDRAKIICKHGDLVDLAGCIQSKCEVNSPGAKNAIKGNKLIIVKDGN